MKRSRGSTRKETEGGNSKDGGDAKEEKVKEKEKENFKEKEKEKAKSKSKLAVPQKDTTPKAKLPKKGKPSKMAEEDSKTFTMDDAEIAALNVRLFYRYFIKCKAVLSSLRWM